MPHIHWVARQNKLEIPNDEEEVNTREIHSAIFVDISPCNFVLHTGCAARVCAYSACMCVHVCA
jgi:hypothetical protein